MDLGLGNIIFQIHRPFPYTNQKGYGETDVKKNWGTGICVSNFFKTSYLLLDGNLHFWKQPSLFLSNSKDIDRNPQYGYSALLIMYLSPFENKNFNFLAQLEYKSKGFLEGENLADDIIYRIELSILEFE